MRIVIDISAARDPDAHRWLDRILLRIEDGWHVWDLTETPDAETIEATPWASDLGRQGNRLRELLVAATQRSAWTLEPHTRRLRVTALPAADLFADLPEGDRQTLAKGFGPNVHECWSVWHVREVRGELQALGGDDLKHGIELIRREL